MKKCVCASEGGLGCVTDNRTSGLEIAGNVSEESESFLMQSHYLAESYIPVQGHIPMRPLPPEIPAGFLHPDGAYRFPRKYGGVDQWAPPYRLEVSRAFIPFIFSLYYGLNTF